MAIVSAGTASPLNLLDLGTATVTARSSMAVSLNFAPQGGKLVHTLKLSGSFSATAAVQSLEQGVVTLPEGGSATIAFLGPLSAPVADLGAASLRVDRLFESLFVDDDIFNLGSLGDAVNAGAGNDVINGNAGNDRLQGGPGNDAINGGSGIDAALYGGSRGSFTLGSNDSGQFLLEDNGAREGRDTLTSIERLQFADGKLALDLNGNAGIVAKILGAVFGAKAVGNKQYVGIGLSYLDQGMSYVDLAGLAVSVTGKSQPREVVDLLWTNVIGSPPSAAQAQPFIDMLGAGTSIGQLAQMAAEVPLNLEHIDLLGLTKTGLEYL